MAYEVFTRRIARAGNPVISISKLGRIGINQHGARLLKNNGVEFVLLMWDKDRRRIAIRPISIREGRAYKLTFSPDNKGSGAGFSAKTFFDYLEYDYSETRSFNADWNETEGILEIAIPKEHLGVSQPRLVAASSSRSK